MFWPIRQIAATARNLGISNLNEDYKDSIVRIKIQEVSNYSEVDDDNQPYKSVVLLSEKQTVTIKLIEEKGGIIWFLDSGATDYIINYSCRIKRINNTILISVAKRNKNLTESLIDYKHISKIRLHWVEVFIYFKR